MLLADFEQCDVVAQIDSDLAWIDELAHFSVDVVLCDFGWQQQIALPDLEGVSVPVVAIVSDEDRAIDAWSAGVKGVLGRSVSAETLVAALTAVAYNLTVIHPDFVDVLAENAAADADLPLEPLTPRESEVLDQLAAGLTNKAIAQELGISDHTVKFHVNAVLSKLDAQSRTEAVVNAIRAGILSL
jgi:DNA-binding NarL/FixJ family response regulator